MILLIDNYDSFTYNLYQYLCELGADVRVERNDELIFELLSPKGGVTVEGREVSALPPSVLSALRLSRESGTIRPVRETVLERIRVRTEYVLFGSQTVSIYVDRERNGVVFNGKASRGGK